MKKEEYEKSAKIRKKLDDHLSMKARVNALETPEQAKEILYELLDYIVDLNWRMNEVSRGLGQARRDISTGGPRY